MKTPNSERLVKAFTCFVGGLSVGPGPAKRKIGTEWPQIRNLYRSQKNQFNQFVRQEPQFTQAQGFLNQAAGSVPATNLSIAPIALSNASSLVAPQAAAIRSNVNPVLASGGALTPEQKRDVDQATLAGFAASGNATGNQAIGAELLNRDAFRTQRFDTALRQSQGVTGQELALEQAGAGLGQESFGQGQTQFGDVLSLQSGALGQIGSEVGTFTNLTDPLLAFAGNLFGGNLQASQQQQLANQNKGAALPGTAGSVIGNILGGIASSDKRLKENIKSIGEKTPEGIPIKTFSYKNDPSGRRYIGVIAQDVEKKVPHAVVHNPRTGMKQVNFSAIHAPFHAISDSGKSSSSPGSGSRGSGLTWGNVSFFDPSSHTRMEGGSGSASGRRLNPFTGTPGTAQNPISLAIGSKSKYHLGQIIQGPWGVGRVDDVGGGVGKTVKGRTRPSIDVAVGGQFRKWAYEGFVPSLLRNVPQRIGRIAGSISHVPGRIAAMRPGMHGRSGFPRAIPVGRGHPMILGRSGFPRAIPVHAQRVGRRAPAGKPTNLGRGRHEVEGSPGTLGFGGFPFGGSPFGGSPSSLGLPGEPGQIGEIPGLLPGGRTDPGFAPPPSPDLSSLIPWDIADTPVDFIAGTPFAWGGGIIAPNEFQ